MRLPVLVSLLALLGPGLSSEIRKRSYEHYDYYAIQLSPIAHISQVAQELELEYEGPLGQLADHHVFSSPRTEQDLVHTSIQDHRTRKRRRDPEALKSSLNHILFHQKAPLKPRMHKRSVLPPPSVHDYSGVAADLPRRETVVPDPPTLDSNVIKQQELAAKLNITDPIFKEQWHLFNTAQPGNDINVTGVWLSGNFGQGATVAIVDDGIDMYSDDIKDNYFAEGSYDYNDPGPEPRPRLSDDHHGTRCAGEIAAVRNNVCGVGVAYQGMVAGIRILSKQISDIDEAEALNYGYQKNHIYSCSWGPPDDGMSMDEPGILIKKAMLNGVQNGRGGRGSLYVFASGNGARAGDNCNFDGYTNSIYSITVGAIDRKGIHPYYSELCSAQLVVTYSSGSGDAIHTTDVGPNKCNKSHGGTSAAAPLAAGIFALVVSARPELSWRDLQWLTVNTAVPVNEADGSWQSTPYGKKFSHKFGYGKLDSYAIVEAAKTMTLVKPQAWFVTPWMHVKQPVPEGDQGLSSHFAVTAEMLKDANFERVEQITVTMNLEHQRRGDLAVELVSPAGVISHLSAARPYDSIAEGYSDWTFMTVAHFGESGVGDWKLIAKDTVQNGKTGNLTDWKMTLWGECIDAAKANPLPMPTGHEDDDHDMEMNPGATSTVSASTVTDINHLPSKPTGEHPPDHIDRPVNAKPTSTPTPTTSSASEPTAPPNQAPNTSNPLPSFFPTFGVGTHTQIWIYAFAVIVLVFISGLGTYLYMAKRRRDLLAGSNLDAYEFEVLGGSGDDDDDDDDDEGSEFRDEEDGGAGAGTGRYDASAADGNGHAPGNEPLNGSAAAAAAAAAAKAKTKKSKGKQKAKNSTAAAKGKQRAGERPKRAGELYDAFASGDSDLEADDEAERGLGTGGGIGGGGGGERGGGYTDREKLLGQR